MKRAVFAAGLGLATIFAGCGAALAGSCAEDAKRTEASDTGSIRAYTKVENQRSTGTIDVKFSSQRNTGLNWTVDKNWTSVEPRSSLEVRANRTKISIIKAEIRAGKTEVNCSYRVEEIQGGWGFSTKTTWKDYSCGLTDGTQVLDPEKDLPMVSLFCSRSYNSKKNKWNTTLTVLDKGAKVN